MRSLVLRHVTISVLILSVLIVVVFLGYKSLTKNPLDGLVTTTIERGTVESLVSVSGVTKARNTAELAFPTPGVVSKVYVREGDVVEAGTILATLGAEALVASRASALADLAVAEADRAELLAGDTSTDRAITNTRVDIARAELERIKNTQSVLLENAKRALRSGTLTARTTDATESALAPTISGTYRCTAEGTYILTPYRSGADSGYSMRVSGLETGTADVAIDQPAPFGTCGLFALFTKGEQYGNSVWNVAIPNTAGESYTANKNALAIAENTARTAMAAATQALTLAEQEQVATNAAPRSEAVSRANARIQKASSAIAQIDAQIGDRAIVAPFTGTVTTVNIVAGESAGTIPLFTILATNDIELKARIPEVDITSITVGQNARVLFDADINTPLTGTVTYISSLPIQIDGVGYFEITVGLDTTPVWLRGGLNADVDIVIKSTADVVRVPKRYLVENSTGTFIRTLNGSSIATTTVTKIADGNDGWVGINGASEGTVIVTP